MRGGSVTPLIALVIVCAGIGLIGLAPLLAIFASVVYGVFKSF